MKRLTDRFDDGTVGVVNILDKTELIEVSHEGEFIASEASVQEAVNRLAAYEDTELTPEQVADFVSWLNEDREELTDLTLFIDIGVLAKYRKIGTLDELAALKEAYNLARADVKELTRNEFKRNSNVIQSYY